jgi:hypothetical protein
MNLAGLSPDAHLFIEHNDNNDLRIGGKIGISFGNFVYLNYGYTIPVGSYENSNISRHSITLTIKYNFVAIADLIEP